MRKYMKMDKKKVGYHLPAELVKQVKMAAIEQGCRDSHVVEAALREHLNKIKSIKKER